MFEVFHINICNLTGYAIRNNFIQLFKDGDGCNTNNEINSDRK